MKDMKQIAYEIAVKAHAGQKRKNGEDYINHVQRVADAVAHLGDDYYCVGMLHDVLEDSDYTIIDLEDAGFSGEVVGSVLLLTRVEESYLDYIIILKETGKIDFARQVKLADLADNLNGATGTLRDKYQMAQYILTH